MNVEGLVLYVDKPCKACPHCGHRKYTTHMGFVVLVGYRKFRGDNVPVHKWIETSFTCKKCSRMWKLHNE